MTEQHFQQLLKRVTDFISIHQLPSGAIPCYRDGLTNPWDHVECAIALDLGGKSDQAARAYEWLIEMQNPDGSWWYTYQDNQPQELAKDSNHSSYVATGVWHHYQVTQDMNFLRQMWPIVEGGINFTLDLQQPTGEVHWARDLKDAVWPSALLAASSCIYQSILSGVKLARALGFDKPQWDEASQKLARAIREQPQLFDTAGDNSRGYAMNWYYPVLSGVVRDERAKEHILSRWEEFIVDGWGCKCSLDQPWVTVAETCELILALSRIGELQKARTLLDWVLRLQDTDGGFWTGIKLPEQIIYPPNEKTTWTSAAAIMAMVACVDSENTGNTIF